jgi:hypothetical protein
MKMVELFEQQNPGVTIETTYAGLQGFQGRCWPSTSSSRAPSTSTAWHPR